MDHWTIWKKKKRSNCCELSSKLSIFQFLVEVGIGMQVAVFGAESRKGSHNRAGYKKGKKYKNAGVCHLFPFRMNVYIRVGVRAHLRTSRERNATQVITQAYDQQE